MAMSRTGENLKLLSKFRGCLSAAVAGNVLGLDFEFGVADHETVVKHVLSPEHAFNERGKLSFSGDTAMTRSVAGSLIAHKGYNATDLAYRFANEYKREPSRGYGRTVVTVFDKLLDPTLDDVYKPARDQFGGSGSHGNGGAMRVAPIALFAYNDVKEMQRIAKETTLLTHAHRHGYNGALLQCMAVHIVLHHDGPMDPDNFLTTLLDYMDVIEEDEMQSRNNQSLADKPYCSKLRTIRELLTEEEQTTEMVVEKLGNGISAYKAVPTAIYSFIHCLKPSTDTSTNGLVRTITYAISLGGDTDTIATMAGAIAGAYYGMESIPENWKTCCEGMDDAMEYANQFYQFVTEDTCDLHKVIGI